MNRVILYLSFINTLCNIIIVSLIMMGQDRRRGLRHWVDDNINMRMWAKGSLFHAVIHKILFRKGNGH